MARKHLGSVGVQGPGGLGCPKCGSTQFTAKRSKKGKAIGVVTVGVGVVLAPKTQVKCVACGAMYKRGGTQRPAGSPILPTLDDVTAPPAGTSAGWYPDPTGRHEQRWWGGVSWMDAVSDGEDQGSDPEGVRLMDTPAQPVGTIAEQLRDLAELRDQGLLTDEEFEVQKARLLA